MKLRAKYGRKHYKTNDSYLNAVYRKNKTIIDEKLADIGVEGISPLKQFKNNVVDHRTSGKLKGLVTVVPASGWTVKSITYVLRHNGSNYWDYYSAGTAVDVPHGGNVTVYMHNTQYGYDESFSVYYR